MSSARILVDMTPLGAGGRNGGAGRVATSLVKQIGQLRPDWEQILLTSTESHAELAGLEASNVRRVPTRTEDAVRQRGLARAALRIAPLQLRAKAKSTVWRWRRASKDGDLLDELRPDLLFCPFMAPYYARNGLPMVVIVHDLQHRALPEYFSDEQRLYREQHVAQISRQADRIVCVSEHVRQSLLELFPTASGRAVTIYSGLLHEFTGEASGVLERLGLHDDAYLLYPANFWPHKNHTRLFEALVEFRNRGGSNLRLLCTGSPDARMQALQRQAMELLGPRDVVFAGYLNEREFTQVLDGCAALIYPSLYEGFGMPVLEAMARGKPVLCSNVTSLPEVAGSVASYFDPTDVNDIARALATLSDHSMVENRIRCGRERAAAFGGATEMARKYINLFEDVLAKS